MLCKYGTKNIKPTKERLAKTIHKCIKFEFAFTKYIIHITNFSLFHLISNRS